MNQDPNTTHKMLSAREQRERAERRKERERIAAGGPSRAEIERNRQATELRARARDLRQQAAKLDAEANRIDPMSLPHLSAPGSDLQA